jgi:hypothetical protein
LAPPGTGVAYPTGLGWWTEGIVGRNVLEVGRRDLFPEAGWKSETLAGSALLAGNHVTTNGSVFLADAYPYADIPMHPSLGVDNGALVRLLVFDDRLITIDYRESSATRRLNLADGTVLESRREAVDGAFVDTRIYKLGDVTVTKRVTLPAEGQRVRFVLEAESDGGLLEAVTVPIMSAQEALLLEAGPLESVFLFQGTMPFGDSWKVFAPVRLTSDVGEASLTVPQDLGPVIAEVLPHSAHAAIRLDFGLYLTDAGGSLESLQAAFQSDVAGGGGRLESFESSDLIRRRDISFALLDTQPEKPWFGDPLDVVTLEWLERAPFFQRIGERNGVMSYLVCLPGVSEPARSC